MNFSFRIENYYPLEDRVFAIYEAAGLEPLGAFVHVPENATEQEVLAAVQAAAPISKWSKGRNQIVDSLLGVSRDGVEQPPVDDSSVSSVPLMPDDVVARRRRRERLDASDWTQLPDAPLSQEQRALWAAYRQALRDVPQQQNFPAEIVWPVPPT
jgi:hypothetical protein